jgi:hypothetical protein
MRSLIIVSVLFLVGCFKFNAVDGSIKCAPDPNRPCPSGYTCNVVTNTCFRGDLSKKKTQGAACGGATDCLPGLFCVDGYCCNAACDGQCQACDLPGQEGSCNTVMSGPVHGSRMPCNDGAGSVCGGSCGGDPNSCTYTKAATVCGSACDGTCDGQGNCSASKAGVCPGGYACGASGCLTRCQSANDCQTYFQCSNNQCTRIPESNCFNGIDDNGDGLIDCADPTCTNGRAVCAPSSATTLGFVADKCPALFSPGTHINQNLIVPTTCSTGCGATISAYCQTDFTADGGGDYCGGGSPGPIFSLGSVYSNSPRCIDQGASGKQILSIKASVSLYASCTATGPGKPDTAYYAASSNFCAGSVSPSMAGCAGGQVCVAAPSNNQAVCTLVTGQQCPSTYPKLAATWYKDGIDDPRTCNCNACTTSGGSCSLPDYRVKNVDGSGTCPVSTSNRVCSGSTGAGHATGCCGWFDHTGGNNYWSNSPNVEGIDVISVPAPTGVTANPTGVANGTATPSANTQVAVCCQ